MSRTQTSAAASSTSRSSPRSGLLFVRELGGAIAARSGADARLPAAIPAYLLAITIAAFALNVPGNQLSRAVESAVPTRSRSRSPAIRGG